MVININIIDSVASIDVIDENGLTQIKIAGDECETLSTLKDDDFVQFMQRITSDVINVMSKPVVKNLQLRTSRKFIIEPDEMERHRCMVKSAIETDYLLNGVPKNIKNKSE